MKILGSQFFAGGTLNLHELCLSEIDSLVDKASSEKPVQMKKAVIWVPRYSLQANNHQDWSWQKCSIGQLNLLYILHMIHMWYTY